MSTCATCKYIGKSYWGSDSDYGGKTYTCNKTNDRRRDHMRPTGDIAEDFMQNFRTFFDAKANQASCSYYEEREVLSKPHLAILCAMNETSGKSAFGFFSESNRYCEQMNDRFVERDEWSSRQRKPSDGTRDWRLTKVGEAEVKRAMHISRPPSDGAPRPTASPIRQGTNR